MDWIIPVNEILCEKITKLNSSLIPPGFHGDVRRVRVVQDSLIKLIDYLGEQSAKAQGLSKVITTAEKLRNSPTHILYLLKDYNAKGGKGDVIGLLKIGQKHLFLFDDSDTVCEVEPFCVLDFYVLPDRQRRGYGRLLFDHMLKDLGTTVEKLAIDGPSQKMEQFLKRNYGIDGLLYQKNNFAVSPRFFDALPEINNPGGMSPAATPVVGRFAAHKPHSNIASVIHGGGSGSHSAEFESTIGSASNSPDDDKIDDVAELERLVNASVKQVKKELKEAMACVSNIVNVAGPESDVEELAELQKSPERPSSLQVEPVLEASAPINISPAGSTASRRDSQFTDRGYFDVKFYHNKLW